MKPAFSLCVYCGSRPGHLPAYEACAQAVGQWIGRHHGQLVYGGGNSGLMGMVAAATQQAGGRVVGIIPHALADKELARKDCDEFHLVDTMHQRKQMMAEHADAFLALPGGIGTFEEFFEVWTWRQLGYHNKPIGLLNVDGYYDGLLAFMRSTVGQGFVSDWQMDLIQQSADLQTLLPQLIQEAGLSEGKGLDAI
jgi:hypothetical protein